MHDIGVYRVNKPDNNFVSGLPVSQGKKRTGVNNIIHLIIHSLQELLICSKESKMYIDTIFKLAIVVFSKDAKFHLMSRGYHTTTQERLLKAGAAFVPWCPSQ